MILEFKTSFGKYHPVFPKNSNKAFILGQAVCVILSYRIIIFPYRNKGSKESVKDAVIFAKLGF